jgi:hypothetical protein
MPELVFPVSHCIKRPRASRRPKRELPGRGGGAGAEEEEDHADGARKRPKRSARSSRARLVTEQFDKETGEVLRRYYCLTDACVAMGLATHYLTYHVFGEGASSHACLFGWREVASGGQADAAVDAPYVDVSVLRQYMHTYLDQSPEATPTWREFLATYVPSTAPASVDEPEAMATPSNLSGRRVMEQYDRASNKLLRRYLSMADASVALGQPAHYLQYKVFGRGARFHTCLFGWKERTPDCSIYMKEGEEYADVEQMRVYMRKFLEEEPHLIPTWSVFVDNFDAMLLPDKASAGSGSSSDSSSSAPLPPARGDVAVPPIADAPPVVIEQYDLDTGSLLRRYASHEEACEAMGQTSYYLHYYVFGDPAKKKDVFDWREGGPYVDETSVEPREDEEYADIETLRLYMDKNLKKQKQKRVTWTVFLSRQPATIKAAAEAAAAEVIRKKEEKIADKAAAKAAKVAAAVAAADAKAARKKANRYKKKSSEATTGSRVIEQIDLETNRILRRYSSMTEACHAMGQPVHYLPYKVFGRGSRFHHCVFGWNELQGLNNVGPGPGEAYEDISALRAYMRAYLYSAEGEEVLPWGEFRASYAVDQGSSSEGEGSEEEYADFELSDRAKLMVAALQVS